MVSKLCEFKSSSFLLCSHSDSSMLQSSRTPQYKFWEWVDDGAVHNAISGKISTEADNEFSHWKMKLIQDNMSLKHEIEKNQIGDVLLQNCFFYHSFVVCSEFSVKRLILYTWFVTTL
ncbi:hypothetical protein LXL04_020817 [Taraxacum kok-saghyz]